MGRENVLAMVVCAREDEPVLRAAGLFEAEYGAMASVVLFAKAPEPSAAPVYAGIWALAGEVRNDGADQPDDLQRLRRRLRKLSFNPPIKRIEVLDGAGADRAGVEARGGDMTIMLRPSGASDEAFRRAMFESVLYESGRPVLLMPKPWTTATLAKTILVAWDGSREATRAVADAERLLANAERVRVLEVDEGSQVGLPGGEIAARLRQRGVQCQHRSVFGRRGEVGEVLVREGEAIGADLIVMGGYGHPRLHEVLFGGVTRAMVRTSPIPLLISR